MDSSRFRVHSTKASALSATMLSMKKILCLRGGGMRGYFTACLLEELEHRTGMPIAKSFDLIAGTSIGGILAMGLSIGMSASDLRRLFEQEGASIFSPRLILGLIPERLRGPGYKIENLTSALQKHFTKEALLSDCQTNCMIFSTVWEGRQEKIWKSWKDGAMPAWLVAAMSAAAQTYFDPIVFQGLHYGDGGVWANEPAVWAAVEAIKLWPTTPRVLVSIACPETVCLTAPARGGLLSVAPEIVGLCIAAGEAASIHAACQISELVCAISPPLMRASGRITDASPGNLKAIRDIAEENKDHYCNMIQDALSQPVPSMVR